MDWDFDGVEFDEESKLREETRKIMELPELPISATCVRVPVMVGHAEAVWVETERTLSPDEARALLGAAPSVARRRTSRRPARRPADDDVLVGRIRQDPTEENGLVLFLACDNLRKGAALNAIQIAELLLSRDGARGLRSTGLVAVAGGPTSPSPAQTVSGTPWPQPRPPELDRGRHAAGRVPAHREGRRRASPPARSGSR